MPPAFRHISLKQDFFVKLRAGAEMDCPCCGRYAKVYRRKIHRNMVRQALTLYRLGGAWNYIHTDELARATEKGSTRDSGFTSLAYWGLIEPKLHDGGEKRTSGFWRLTERGVDFLRGRVRLPKYALVYDNRVLGFEGDMTDAKDAYGAMFNFEELMQGA